MNRTCKQLLTIALAVAMALSMMALMPQQSHAAKKSITDYEWGKQNGPFPGSKLNDGSMYYPALLGVQYDYNKDKRATKGGNIFEHNELISNRIPPGVTYDRATNTLTLKNFRHPDCDIHGHMLGDDFTIEVIGNCEVRTIDLTGNCDEYEPYGTPGSQWWGGSVRFTGSGKLIVNKKKQVPDGIEVFGWGSVVRVMIDKTVTLNVYGQNKPIVDGLNVSPIFIGHTADFNYKDAITVDNKPITKVNPRYTVGAEDAHYADNMPLLKHYWVKSPDYIVIIKGTGKAYKENPITVKGKTATLKQKTLKKKNQTLAVSKVLTIKNKNGTLTFTKKSGNKKITINKKTGKVTVKKGLAKGTYTVGVHVKTSGDKVYKQKTVTKNFKIKVK